MPKEPRSLRDLIKDPPKENDDWIKGLLPRSAKVMIGGEAKIGKSFIALEIVRSLACCQPCFAAPELEVRFPTKVWIIEKELWEGTFKERCGSVFKGLDPDSLGDRVFYSSGAADIRLDEDEGLRRIWKFCEAYRPNVLVLDPIAKFMSGDESSGKDVAHFLRQMDRLLEKFSGDGLSILYTHHYGKPGRDRDGNVIKGRNSGYDFRGSSRFYDDVDGLIAFERDRSLGSASHWYLDGTPEARRSRMPEKLPLRVRPEPSFGPCVELWEGPRDARGGGAAPAAGFDRGSQKARKGGLHGLSV